MLHESEWENDLIEGSIYFLLKSKKKDIHNKLKNIFLNLKNDSIDRKDRQEIKSLLESVESSPASTIVESISIISLTKSC